MEATRASAELPRNQFSSRRLSGSRGPDVLLLVLLKAVLSLPAPTRTLRASVAIYCQRYPIENSPMLAL